MSTWTGRRSLTLALTAPLCLLGSSCLISGLEDALDDLESPACEIDFRASGGEDAMFGSGDADWCDGTAYSTDLTISTTYEGDPNDVSITVQDIAQEETGTFTATVSYWTPRNRWSSDSCSAEVTTNQEASNEIDWVLAGTITCDNGLDAADDNEISDPLMLDAPLTFQFPFF